MTKRLPYLIAFGLFTLAFATVDPGIDAITARLEQFRKQYPQEKIHLHTNQPFYSIGDTIYYKAYMVDAENNRPSLLSNILYVDLINGDNQVQQTMLLPVENGITWGSIILSDSLTEGRYRLRAYTNWMRNFDEAYFFSKELPVGNALNNNTIKIPVATPPTARNLQFFPEGGEMVSDLPAHVGFKALRPDGLGIPVTGTINDEGGKQVAVFQSAFAGIGSFSFTPAAGHTYFALATYTDGAREKIALPKAAAAGYVLRVDNTDDEKIIINIAGKGVAEKNIILAAQSNSRLITTEKLALVNGKVTTTILKEKLPTGITQLTLFDDATKPVAERLVFINHEDQLLVHITPDKTIYHSNEPVQLNIEVTDDLENPIAGSFSLGVTDASLVNADRSLAPTIVSNLLLTADLKGYIEQPGYYFTHVDEQKTKALDNLLLTQGWRRFSWNALLANKYPALSFKADKNMGISGKVVNAVGEPVPKAAVTLITKKGSGYIADTLTDDQGAFTFDRLYFADSMPVAIRAVAPNGSKEVNILLNEFAAPAIAKNTWASDRTPDSALLQYIARSKPRFEELSRNKVIDRKGTLLKEVTVKAKQLTKVQEAVAPSSNLNGPGRADHVLTYMDIANCTDLTVCLPGKLAGVFFKPVIINGQVTSVPYSTLGMGKPMLIIVDGMDMSSTDGMFSLKGIPAGDVQSVEVLRPGVYASAYGFRGINGVIVITTKRGGLDYYGLDEARKKDNKLPKGVAFATIKGYSPDREFYVPAYTPSSTTAGLRSTIYWQPNIVTSEEGKATLSFSNSTKPGRYEIVLEGISGNGKAGTAFFTYEVVK